MTIPSAERYLVAFSGGKDSLATLIWAAKNLPKDKILVAHAATRDSDWPGLLNYVKKVCNQLAVKLVVRETELSFEDAFFGKNADWKPHLGRFCRYNSEKIKSVTSLLNEFKGQDVVMLEGSRAEESPERAKRGKTGRVSNAPWIRVYRPIFSFSEADVWKYIRDSKIEPFHIYKEGAWRFGCWPCPFTSVVNIALIRKLHPELWRKWKNWERRAEKQGRRMLHGSDSGNKGTIDDAADSGDRKMESSRARMAALIEGKQVEKSEPEEPACGLFDLEKGRIQGADRYIVAFSGGKDSLAALIWATQHVPKHKIHVCHLGCGDADWPGQEDYVKKVCRKLGVKLTIQQTPMDFLRWFFTHKWYPGGPWCRYNGEMKAKTTLAMLKEHVPPDEKVVLIEGSRAEESGARADRGQTGDLKTLPGVKIFRPAYGWKEADVWRVIRGSGIEPFYLYKEGAWRFGCWPCPFTSVINISLVRKLQPKLWAKWLAAEKRAKRQGRYMLHGGDPKSGNSSKQSLTAAADSGDKRIESARARMEALITGKQVEKADGFCDDCRQCIGKILDPQTIDVALGQPSDRMTMAAARLAETLGLQVDGAGQPAVEIANASGIVSGESDLLVDHRRGLRVGHSFPMAEAGDVVGTVTLGKPDQIDLWKFSRLAARHGISETKRSELWPSATHLWAYPVDHVIPPERTREIVALADAEVEAIDRARELVAEFQAALPGFIERQARFLEALSDPGAKEAINLILGLPDVAKDLAAALSALRGETGKLEGRSSLVEIGRELLAELRGFEHRVPASPARNAITNAMRSLEELDRISREMLGREGGHFKKRETAPTFPSGKEMGSEIRLESVLEFVKPIMLRRSAVQLVGGLVNWGKTKNDVDFLIRGPVDDDTAHVVKFRLGRMFPPDLAKRIQFLLDDELGGPFTDHIELMDLWLVPRTHTVNPGADGSFKVIEMSAIEKKTDPLLEIPKARGKRKAAYQYHFRGRSLHGDLRMQVEDYLVGWTLTNSKGDKIPDVSEVREARRLARRFNKDGSFFEKDWTAPESLLAVPKGRMPMVWLEIDAEKFEPGEIGATTEKPGIIVRVTDPELRVEFGIQKAWAHEYFFTGDRKFTGRLFFRQLIGEGGEEIEEEAGRVTPEGETFWRSFWTKDLLPSVLNRRSVERKTMPPDGYSAIPSTLEQIVPQELRYWEASGDDAREKRDQLVADGFFTPENIKIVDGEFRRVVTKFYLDVGGSYAVARKQDLVPYGIAWQFWKSRQVSRSGPSRQVWHLVVGRSQGGAGFDAWKLTGDPTVGDDQISGIYRQIDDGDLMAFDGAVDPGQSVGGEVLNDSKETPSWIRNLDHGKAELIESENGYRKLRLLGKVKRTITLRREEEGSDFWVLQVDDQASKGQSSSAEIFVKRGGSYRFVECPACGTVNLRAIGLKKLETGESVSGLECNDCGAQFGISGPVEQRASFDESGLADLDDVPLDEQPYAVLKAVPVRDGVQIWDPDRKDPNADRSQLRPLAIYQPMKVPPRSTNEFRDVDPIFDDFATPTILQMGVIVEPKYNGFRLSLQKRGPKTLIFTEDEKRDLSKVLPGLSAELKKISGDFVIDGEGMAVDADGNFIPRRDLAQFRGKQPVDDSTLRIPIFDALFVPDSGNITTKVQAERRRRVEKLIAGKFTRLFVAPSKMAKTRAELISAIEWAKKQPGSEGAMLKGVEATYSLGGENDLWAKFKASRRLRAIVYGRHEVKDSPGVWNYLCAIGPVSSDEANRWDETVEIGGKLWVPVGTTFNSKEQIANGKALEVEATEILFDKSRERFRIRWFTPTVIGPADKPMTVDEVVDLLRDDEIKKLLSEALTREIKLVKAAEERFVFGIVLEPNDGDGGAPLDPDTQSDIYSAEEIRQAAHRFMEDYRNLGVMHRELANDRMRILESFIAPAEFLVEKTKIRKGTWLLGIRVVDDKLWHDVKTGKFTGFSIGGSALRAPVEAA